MIGWEFRTRSESDPVTSSTEVKYLAVIYIPIIGMRRYSRRTRKTRKRSKRKSQRGGSLEISAVCTLMLGEDKYVDEWVEYYLFGLKFDRIYIYDNSEHNVLKYLETKYPNVFIIHSGEASPPPGQARGMRAIPVYNDWLSKNRALPDNERVRWCAFVDADEFIVLKKHNSINHFLREYCKEGGVSINWYIYGDSKLTAYSPEPVTKRFVWREAKVNQHVRTIVVCDDVESYTEIHGVGNFKPGKNKKDTNGKIVVGPFNPDGPTDIIYINHYFTKTKEEFNIKKNRGKSDVGDYRNNSDFQAHNFNEVMDDSAYKIYLKAQENMPKSKTAALLP